MGRRTALSICVAVLLLLAVQTASAAMVIDVADGRFICGTYNLPLKKDVRQPIEVDIRNGDVYIRVHTPETVVTLELGQADVSVTNRAAPYVRAAGPASTAAPSLPMGISEAGGGNASSGSGICPYCHRPLAVGNHRMLSCGHRGCLVPADHTRICDACGGYTCDGRDHSRCPDCGERMCVHVSYYCEAQRNPAPTPYTSQAPDGIIFYHVDPQGQYIAGNPRLDGVTIPLEALILLQGGSADMAALAGMDGEMPSMDEIAAMMAAAEAAAAAAALAPSPTRQPGLGQIGAGIADQSAAAGGTGGLPSSLAGLYPQATKDPNLPPGITPGVDWRAILKDLDIPGVDTEILMKINPDIISYVLSLAMGTWAPGYEQSVFRSEHEIFWEDTGLIPSIPMTPEIQAFLQQYPQLQTLIDALTKLRGNPPPEAVYDPFTDSYVIPRGASLSAEMMGSTGGLPEGIPTGMTGSTGGLPEGLP